MLLAPERVEYEEKISYNPRPRIERQTKVKPLPKPLLVFMVLVAFATGLFITAKHAQLSVLGNDINEMQQQIQSVSKQNERLQLEIAKLSSPERIEVIATTKLGMQEPNVHQIQLVTPFPDNVSDAFVIAENNQEITPINNNQQEKGVVNSIARLVSDIIGGISQVEASEF